MEIPTKPNNEVERLKALREYAILDTLPEQEFEDITKIASEICQTPIALITLIDADRQWFKSHFGIDGSETPRDEAFCAHAINEPYTLLNVKDARKDSRFAQNPNVTGDPHVVFYAGMPLVNPDGYSLGTICVIDKEPRELSEKQIHSLKALSNQVVKLMELRKLNKKLEESQKEIETRNSELEQFFYIVSHDIKSPLNNIITLTSILLEDLEGKLDQEGLENIQHISNSTSRLKTLIDGIISHYRDVNIIANEKNVINIESLLKELSELLDAKNEYEIKFNSSTTTISTNEVALKQILINLVSNAIKYNDKPKVKIDINISDTVDAYHFIVQDNGMGIPKAQFSKIFGTFNNLGVKDRFNNTGTGIGLSTVKKLIEKLGGTIEVDSEVGQGTTFKFSIKK
jgi:signal transduction histidine kinase